LLPVPDQSPATVFFSYPNEIRSIDTPLLLVHLTHTFLSMHMCQ